MPEVLFLGRCSFAILPNASFLYPSFNFSSAIFNPLF